MSSRPEIAETNDGGYDPFSQLFYDRVGDEPEIMARVPEVRAHVNNILRELGVSDPSELPPELQRRIKRESVIRIPLGKVL